MANQTQVVKWGNTLAVRFPEVFTRKARLEEGGRLSFDLRADGSIVLRARRRTYSLDELVAGISEKNRHSETDW